MKNLVHLEGWRDATLSSCAAANNNLEAVLALLENDANINSIDNSQETPLMSVLREKHADIAAVLIEKGCEVNTDADGVFPLYLAASHNMSEIIALLIKHGAKRGYSPLN